MDTLSRRSFVAAGLAVGFAAAVEPVSAETITTDAKGLVAGAVKVKGPDGVEFPAYRAMPDKGDKFPVILVVEEIFGVHEHIQDVCRRLAKKGYFAIAPELFARQGSVSKITAIPEIQRSVVSQVPDAQVMTDLDATVAYAKATRKADTAKLGITGFCWGGRQVWLYSAHNPNLKAGVAWYGRLVGQSSALQPRHPVDVAKELKAPVLGLYGGKDTGIPLDTVEQMKAAIKAAGGKSEFVVYPEAGHAFHADYRPSYDETAARDGFQKALEWFKKHG
ncbi:MAG TPA: dienelactone hydrolase family protein, partial [Armatimonadaceae bacterium]|nr:dienelactone hydrolase family protein [Armatimonadaceae bacterium]